MQAIDAAVWMVAQTTSNVPRIGPSRLRRTLLVARRLTEHLLSTSSSYSWLCVSDTVANSFLCISRYHLRVISRSRT
jgi:hypothetical protein